MELARNKLQSLLPFVQLTVCTESQNRELEFYDDVCLA